jgi:hypothetical protein
MANEIGEVRDQGLLEATNGTRVSREPAAPAPARSEIRIVSSSRIERVPTTPVVLAEGVPVVMPSNSDARPAASAAPQRDDGSIPTLKVVASTDDEWKDLGCFNLRFQRRGGEERLEVRHVEGAGAGDKTELARWAGQSVETAADWMRSQLAHQASIDRARVAAPPKERPLQCQIDITEVYAFQDPEAIDPRPLSFAGASPGAPLSPCDPLTLSVALAITGPDATAIVGQDKRCRVAVYAKAFPSGVRSEVGSFVLEVGAAVGNWVARVPLKKLDAGRYRLSIVASLEAPLSGVGYREIPMVQVS